MKSAEARLQAMGMFQTTAMRSRALTSGSCGCGSSGSQKKMRKSISFSDDLGPDLLVAAERPALQFLDRETQLPLQDFAGRAGGVDLVVRQQNAVELGPFQQVAFLVVVGDQRDLLVVLHGNAFVGIPITLRSRQPTRSRCVRERPALMRGRAGF